MVIRKTTGYNKRGRRHSTPKTIKTSPMSASNNLSDLSGRQQLDLLILVGSPVMVLAVFLFAPTYTASVLAVAVITMIASAEDVARTIDSRRPGQKLRGMIGATIGVSVVVLVVLGVVVIHARGANITTLIVPGALVGAFLAMGVIGLIQVADYRPQLALWGIALAFVVLLVAGLWIVSHLIGIATHGRQAALAASAILAFFGGIGLFLARDVL